MPTAGLPIAFAHADLRDTSGWKARLEAAERLARGRGRFRRPSSSRLYRERRPAASGGVWDRATAIQALDRALADGDAGRRSRRRCSDAWAAMQDVQLRAPLRARCTDRALQPGALPAEGRALAFRIGLLTPAFVEARDRPQPPRRREERFLVGARPRPSARPRPPPRPCPIAVRDGFTFDGVPAALCRSSSNRSGRARRSCWRSEFSDGAFGDFRQGDRGPRLPALSWARDAARRAALELLVLERRG